jgi:hypothetical protein
MKFKGKALTRERVGWWISIILCKFLGGRIRLENSHRTIKVFPFLWRGKLHVYGAEKENVTARFEWPYTLSLRLSVSSGLVGEPSTHLAGKGKVCAVLCHLPALAADRVMEFFKAMTPDACVVLAYGGKKEEFEAVTFSRKFFITDDRIRGVGYRQSYFGLMDNLAAWMRSERIEPRWITILDYDCVPLDRGWNDSLADIMDREQADMGGNYFRNCTGDNSLFVCNALRDGILQRLEEKFPCIQLYQCLGALLCFSAGGFHEIRRLREDFQDIFFEVSLPTCARLQGLRLLSLDSAGEFTKGVRFRPGYAPEEIADEIHSGKQMIHPVKALESVCADILNLPKNR